MPDKSLELYRLEFVRTLGSSDGVHVVQKSLHESCPSLGDVPFIEDELNQLIRDIEEGRCRGKEELSSDPPDPGPG